MSANSRGALFMLAAMGAFAVEDTLFKAATQTVAPGLAMLIFGVLGTVLFAGLSRRAGERVWTAEAFRPRLMWRSGFEIAGRLFFALALAYAPLSLASAILQAAPLVVTLGAAALLGERVGAGRWIATGVGFIGVLMVLRPGGAAFDASLVFAVLATVGFAGRDLATRAAPPAVSAHQLGTLGFVMVTLAGAIILAVSEVPMTVPSSRAAGLLALTAIVGVTAYSALTRAMRSGEVSVVAPFRYVRLVFALILAFALFGERPDAVTLTGAALIVGSGVYTLVRGRPRRGWPRRAI